MKERELLKRLIKAVGDCEDTDALLKITKEAEELLCEARDLAYYRREIAALQGAALRAATAAEYLMTEFDKRYPEVEDDDSFFLSA